MIFWSLGGSSRTNVDLVPRMFIGKMPLNPQKGWGLKHNPRKNLCSEIYSSNFDVRQTAQKTQSSNCVLKLSLHKILFWSISKQLDFRLTFKINLHAMFFFILSYYLPSRCKKTRDFTLWSPNRVLPWTQSLQCL